MRQLGWLALATMLVGCASAPVGMNADPSVSTALVFDPPITRDAPALDLSRDQRAPQAFVGYESPMITYYYLRIDDQQRNIGGYNFDRYERQSYVERYGQSTR